MLELTAEEHDAIVAAESAVVASSSTACTRRLLPRLRISVGDGPSATVLDDDEHACDSSGAHAANMQALLDKLADIAGPTKVTVERPASNVPIGTAVWRDDAASYTLVDGGPGGEVSEGSECVPGSETISIDRLDPSKLSILRELCLPVDANASPLRYHLAFRIKTVGLAAGAPLVDALEAAKRQPGAHCLATAPYRTIATSVLNAPVGSSAFFADQSSICAADDGSLLPLDRAATDAIFDAARALVPAAP